MKRENIVLWALKQLIVISAGMGGLMALLAGWRFLEKGKDGYFASDFSQEEDLILGVFALILIPIVWVCFVIKEVLKRQGFNLESVEDGYSGPDEPLLTRGLKMIVNWLLLFSVLIAAAMVLAVAREISVVVMLRALRPEILVFAILIPVIVLGDMAWTALQRRLRSKH